MRKKHLFKAIDFHNFVFNSLPEVDGSYTEWCNRLGASRELLNYSELGRAFQSSLVDLHKRTTLFLQFDREISKQRDKKISAGTLSASLLDVHLNYSFLSLFEGLLFNRA